MSVKFLIVDDEKDACTLLEVILSSIGCETTCLQNGQDAVNLLEKPEDAQHFDAILLDIMMPGLDGFEVLKRIRTFEHTKEIPVILISSQDASIPIMTGYQLGANYFITKPFTKAQVIKGLDMVLSPEDIAEEVSPNVKSHNIPEDW